MDIERILLALRWSSLDALFAVLLCGASYLLLSTGAPVWKLIVCLAVVVFVCNWIAVGPEDSDNFPGGPPAAA